MSAITRAQSPALLDQAQTTPAVNDKATITTARICKGIAIAVFATAFVAFIAGGTVAWNELGYCDKPAVGCNKDIIKGTLIISIAGCAVCTFMGMFASRASAQAVSSVTC